MLFCSFFPFYHLYFNCDVLLHVLVLTAYLVQIRQKIRKSGKMENSAGPDKIKSHFCLEMLCMQMLLLKVPKYLDKKKISLQNQN